MFQGLWYTWKLNDNVIPFQGVYIIECDERFSTQARPTTLNGAVPSMCATTL